MKSGYRRLFIYVILKELLMRCRIKKMTGEKRDIRKEMRKKREEGKQKRVGN